MWPTCGASSPGPANGSEGFTLGSILQDRYCATRYPDWIDWTGFLELLNRNMFKSAFVSNANVKQPDLVPVANLWYKFSLGSSN